MGVFVVVDPLFSIVFIKKIVAFWFDCFLFFWFYSFLGWCLIRVYTFLRWARSWRYTRTAERFVIFIELFQNLPRSQSFCWIFLQHLQNKTIKIKRIIFNNLRLTINNILAKADDILPLERMAHGGKLITDTSQSPNISFIVIFLVFDDFRGKIEWCSYSTVKPSIIFEYFRYSKVSKLHGDICTYNFPE